MAKELPSLTEEEFDDVDYLNGWEYVSGTEKIDPQEWVNLVTRVYAHDGRFFAVTVAQDVGNGGSADAYEGELVEVYPHSEVVTTYKSEPQSDEARKVEPALRILREFISEQEVSCPESIYQRDLPLHELVDALCEAMGAYLQATEADGEDEAEED